MGTVPCTGVCCQGSVEASESPPPFAHHAGTRCGGLQPTSMVVLIYTGERQPHRGLPQGPRSPSPSRAPCMAGPKGRSFCPPSPSSPHPALALAGRSMTHRGKSAGIISPRRMGPASRLVVKGPAWVAKQASLLCSGIT